MGFMATLKAQGLDNPRFLLSYSVLLIRSGEYEKARDLLKKSEKVPGMNDEQKTQLFTNYAACMYRLGSLDKGINLLEKRALRAPNGMLYQTLGYLYCEKFDMNHVPDFEAIDAENMQKHAQAVEEVKAQAAAAGVEPSLPEPPTPARDAYLAQKERAQKFIEESIDYDDEDTICLDNMAQWNYRVLGNKEKAREYFEKAIELKDDQIDTLWFLSRYDLEEGNTAKALEHLNKALDSRFSPLNYKTKQDFENEIARLKA